MNQSANPADPNSDELPKRDSRRKLKRHAGKGKFLKKPNAGDSATITDGSVEINVALAMFNDGDSNDDNAQF